MTLVDWAVIVILVCTVFGGLIQGFFRSVCALGGLVIGLVVAAWNYGRVADLLNPLVRIPAVANTIAFLLIAIVVSTLIGLLGSLLAKLFRLLGLGWLDSLAGAVFGFFQGVVLIVIGILVIVAFFPEELEQKLLKLEHDYHGLAEADIAETRFEVRLTKAGKYEPAVVGQRELSH